MHDGICHMVPPWMETPPPDGEQTPPPRMVTVRVVRILLECILVLVCNLARGGNLAVLVIHSLDNSGSRNLLHLERKTKNR